MRSTHVLIGLVLVALVAAPATVTAGGGGDASQLAAVRRATAQFHDVTAAEAAGYVSTVVCASSPAGAMGVHYVNPALLDDVLDPVRPEFLVYEPTAAGLRLVAVEYMIPAAATSVHPELFGQPFEGPMAGHSPDQPVHYDLHAWIWRPNPSGMFTPWNRRVQCPAP